MRLVRLISAMAVPLVAIAFGTLFSFRPMTPSGSLDQCGDAWHAASLKTGGGNPAVPTVGQLCHPLGVDRLGYLAIIVLVSLGIGFALAWSLMRDHDPSLRPV